MQTYVLKNAELTAAFSTMGAEVISVKRGSCEYIWQGDPTYWKGRAPMLFPICGRLYGGQYTYEGKTYEMACHGFMRNREFRMVDIGDDSITFSLESDAQTRALYPFDFRLTVTHLLQGSSLFTEVTVENTGDEILPAAFGAHPGFNVPLEGNGKFTDYYLEFTEPCSPDEILMTDTCFRTGRNTAYPLRDGKRLPLRHDLFLIDAVFLSRVASGVTLKSDTTERSVTVKYPDMPYIGVWHKPGTEAPYVCIEPWCGMPSYDGQTDDFSTKSDMFRIVPGGEKTVCMSMSFD